MRLSTRLGQAESSEDCSTKRERVEVPPPPQFAEHFVHDPHAETVHKAWFT
jgi:hypothetical protein